MPTYEFRCPAGHDFEKFYRKISDSTEAELACPECGQMATRRMSAGAGLLFKGSGFYLTDYGRSGKRGAGDAAAASASGESKGESKSESKSGAAGDGAGASRSDVAPAAAKKDPAPAKPKDSASK